MRDGRAFKTRFKNLFKKLLDMLKRNPENCDFFFDSRRETLAMMLRGHIKVAMVGHQQVEFRPCALASFGLNACPNTPSSQLGMQVIGANDTSGTKSAEQTFSDHRRSMH